MQPVTQIKVGKHKTGIVGLDKALKDIAAEMIKRLSKKNFIPSEAYDEYEKDFISQAETELKKQQGMC